ncbi:MAG: hypothetical protein K2I94_07240, partial [Muribaculaceae bacterium]|nr:hypothetical protein [Muribaculaceae bacterium]
FCIRDSINIKIIPAPIEPNPDSHPMRLPCENFGIEAIKSTIIQNILGIYTLKYPYNNHMTTRNKVSLVVLTGMKIREMSMPKNMSDSIT